MREFSVIIDSKSVTATDVEQVLSRGGIRTEKIDVSETAPSRTAVSTAEDTENHEKTHTNTEDN